MRLPLSILVLALVLAEIAVFVLVGEAIGVLATLALTLASTVAGAMLLRWTGVATLVRIRAELAAGRAPTRPLAHGAVGTAAALLLLLPGFITDAVGLLLVFRPTRELLWSRFRRRFERGIQRRAAFARRGDVIELDQGEYASESRSNAPARRAGGHEA